MGAMIEAKCKCGFKSKVIYVGAGITNFQTVDLEPAMCQKCRKLLVLNYKTKYRKCPDCKTEIVFYNDKSLQNIQAQNRSVKQEEGFEWGDFKLPNVSYLCPECGKFDMYFFFKGYWD